MKLRHDVINFVESLLYVMSLFNSCFFPTVSFWPL